MLELISGRIAIATVSQKKSPYTYLGMTVGICPLCHRSLSASLLERDGKIFMSKRCPEHGLTKTIIASDSDWFKSSVREPSASAKLKKYQTESKGGCPQDCGACPDHETNNALPVIEITDICNLSCPVCFAGDKNNYRMSIEVFDRCLDIVESSGTDVESIVITGGEPTAHPGLVSLIDRAFQRPWVPHVSIATNGVLLASREELVAQLAERKNIHVLLQLDTLNPSQEIVMRGKDLSEVHRKALSHLAKYNIPTIILMTAQSGVNDDQLGALFKLVLEHDFITGFQVQTMAYTGVGGRSVSFDPMRRITFTDLIHGLVDQSDGLLRVSDFFPLPHPHPVCVSALYLLKLSDGSYVPFPRFIDRTGFRQAISGSFNPIPDADHEELLRDTINQLWIAGDTVDKGHLILEALKGLLEDLYPEGRVLDDVTRFKTILKRVKNVMLHRIMDDHNLDAGILRKCPTMNVLPDGRMIPHCAYRVLHRHTDQRWRKTESS